MRISRRTGASLLLTAVFVSMLMQYPMFKAHSGNWDNYFILFMTKTISERGVAPWVGTWASYFGLHHTSYPQGAPFFISSFQQVSGWNSEWLILVYSFSISTMLVMLSFILALFIRKRDYLFAFFLALIFSTAPSYLNVSEWTASARGLFISLLPFFVILNMTLLKKESLSKKTWIFLNVFVFVLLFSIHRLSFFLLVTAVPAFLLSYFLFGKGKYSGAFETVWGDSRARRYIAATILVLFTVYFIYVFYSQHKLMVVLSESYSSGRILSGYSPVMRLLNIAFGIIASAGILAVFIFVPIGKNLKNRGLSVEMGYSIATLLFLSFIILYPMYFRPYAALFLSIFIALFLLYGSYGRSIGIKKLNFRLNMKSVAVMLVVSLAFSATLQAQWNGQLFGESKQWMDYNQEEVVTTISNVPGDDIFLGGQLRRVSSLNSEKLTIPPGPYRYDLCFYLFTNRPDIMSVDDLNLKFSPQLSWNGEIYLYSEDINVTDSVEPLYRLKYYDSFETEETGSFVGPFSNKNITKYNYEIYENEKYHIYMVDNSNPSVYETDVYFAKP